MRGQKESGDGTLTYPTGYDKDGKKKNATDSESELPSPLPQRNEVGTIHLNVQEAYTRDIGLGVVQIAYGAIESLTANTGDIIQVKAKRLTAAKCLPLYPANEKNGIVRPCYLQPYRGWVSDSPSPTSRSAESPDDSPDD